MVDSAVTFEWSLGGSSVSSPYFTDCGKGFKSQRILGGYQKFGTDVFVRKILYDIPPHYQYQLTLRIYFIDLWQLTESIWVKSNGVEQQISYQQAGYIVTDANTNCGGAALDYIYDVSFPLSAHSADTHEIIIKSNLQQDSAIGSWGIKNFIYTVKACDMSCNSCTAAMQGNQCFDCYVNSTKGALLCYCNVGFYPYFPQPLVCTKKPCMICKQCDDSCYTCTGADNSSCTTCSGTKYLQDSQCVDTCRDGTYKNNALNDNRCSQCHISCKTCAGGNDQYKCTSCSSPNFLNIDFSCVSVCPNYYYGLALPVRKCDTCATHCLHCSGNNANQCTECETSYFLLNSQCSLTCPNKYYADPVSKQCLPCYASCFNCSGVNDYQCSQCDGSNFLDKTQPGKAYCVAQCPDKYFGDVGLKKCRDCSEGCPTCNCFKCTVLNICTQCQSPDYLVNNICQTCQDGFYGDNITQVCKPCNESCLKCSGGTSSNCTQCKPLLFLYILNGIQGRCLGVCPSTPSRFGQNQVCVETCDPGYYGDSDDPMRMCKQCNSNCALCYGASSNQCTQCQNNTYLSNTSCVAVCPDGTYQKADFTCSPCNEYCGTCSGPLKSDCLTCAPPLYGTLSVCDSQCPLGTYGDPITRKCNVNCSDGYYKDIINRVCLVCNQKCLTCVGPQATNCIICKDPFFDNNGQCDQCPLFTYGIVDAANGGIRKCINCPNYCAVCQAPGPVCLECVQGRKLTSTGCLDSCPNGFFSHPVTGVCLNECPIGYYGNTLNNDCNSCASRCGKCYGSRQEDCYQCVHPYYLYNTDCISICPIGYFADSLTWNCIQCPINCDNCNGTDSCQQCSVVLVLYNNQCINSCPTDLYEREGICVSDCGKGYYIMANQVMKKCGQCSRFCVECIDLPTKCTSCKYTLNTKLFLQGNVCQYQCDEGYYLPTSSQNTCIQCDKKCKNCALSSDNCLSCQNPYSYYQGQCLSKCPSPLQGYQNECIDCFPGYYYNEEAQECQKCHISCKQCFGRRYDECKVCWNKRGQGQDNQPVDGICECQEGYTEMFERLCKSNDEATSKYSAVSGLSITNTVFELIFYVLSANPVSFIMMANLGQNLNMISYLDMPYGFQLQETVRLLGKYHITQGLGAPAFHQKNRNQMNQDIQKEQSSSTLLEEQKRNLYDTYNTWSERKFEKNSFTASFFSNMLIFFIIQGFVWLFCYLLNRHVVKYCDHHFFIFHLNHLITYNLPIAFFLLSYFEIIISIFLQFRFGDYSSLFNQFSLVFALFGVAYIAFIVQNCIKTLNFQKSYEKHGTVDYNQKRVYWIYLRLENILQRNFHLIILFQKTLIAAILVFMYETSLVAQAALIFVIQLLMLVYLVVCRPLNRKRYYFLQIFNEFFTCIIWILLIEESHSQENSIISSNIDHSYHIHNIILMLFIAHFLFILFEFVVNIPLLIQRYKMARSIAIESISRFIEWLNRRNIQKRQVFLLKMLNAGRKDESLININDEDMNQSKLHNYLSKHDQDYIQLLTGHDLKNGKSGTNDDIIDLEIDEEEVNLIKQKSKLKANNLNLIIQQDGLIVGDGAQSSARKGRDNRNINLENIGNNKEDQQSIIAETQLINLDLLKDKNVEKIVLDKELVFPSIQQQRKAQNHHRLYLKDELQINRFKVFGEYTGNKFTLSCQGRQPQTDLNNGLYDIYEYDEFMHEVLLKDENEDSFEVIDFMDRNQQYYSDKFRKNNSSGQQIGNQFAIFPNQNRVELQNNNVITNPLQKRQVEVEEAANQVRSYMDMETQGKFKILKKKDANSGRIFTIALPLSVDLHNKRQALANKVLSMKPNAIQRETKDITMSSLTQSNLPKKASKATVLNAWQFSQPNIYQNQKKW